MRYAGLIACLVVMFSCSEEKEQEAQKSQPVAVPVQKITDATQFRNDVYSFDNSPEAVGVFDIPEMLVLSITDSANSKDVSATMVKNFGLLEEDLTTTGAQMNGPAGMITYNNDSENFKFESVMFIQSMPKTQPKHSKIVVLEASKMLVYNYYGTYQNLFSAYDKIKRYCNKNDLLQSGPMREFYMNDPEKEKNPERWHTRIMLPVISMHK